MFTCYLIDDDGYAIEALARYIEKVPWLTIVGSHTNPLLALAEIQSGIRPDIVFLDVEMPELSGVEVAKLLPKGIALVFTTSYRQYAFEAFQQDAMDFLLKPFSLEQFLGCINKVRGKIEPKPNSVEETSSTKIFVNPGSKGKIVQVELTEVTHVEATDHAVCIHLLTERVVTNMSIKKIQERLPVKTFIRIHRAYIVNIDLIKVIEASLVTLKNGVQVPLGEAYRTKLMGRIR